MYRTVIEKSCMSNNDEWIYYTEKEITDIKELKIHKRMFDTPRIVISRPVFDIEVQKGLELKSGVSIYNQKIPPNITSFLDALYKMKITVDFLKEYKNPDMSLIEAIIKHFTLDYYDCMSGGLNGYISSIIRELAERANVDKNLQLYPKMYKKEGEIDYNTLEDFLNETKDSPDLKEMILSIQKQIPQIDKFLLEA